MTTDITSILPDVYEALDTVSREQVGFIPAVRLAASSERAAVGQTIKSPVAPPAELQDIVPGINPPAAPDQTIGQRPLTINNSKAAPFVWTGEAVKGANTGVGFARLRSDQIAQALRALNNAVERDIATLVINSSRAYGVAATAPFGTANDFSDFARSRQILIDNGAPESDLHLVCGSNAMATMQSKQSTLLKANEAGTDDLLRNGLIARVLGLGVHQSGQVQNHVAGSTVGDVTVTAATAVGETKINLTTGAAMSVSVKAGDIVTVAGDANKYVAASDLNLGAATTGDLHINAPGLRESIAANTAVTVGDSYEGNMVFHRGAIALATRMPAAPEEGDSAEDKIEITDPHSGITYELSVYGQYRQVRYELALAWGCSMMKPEHAAILLG